MSTKKPPAVAKATSTKPAKVVISIPAKKIALYHLDTCDAAIVAYYSDGGVDYAEVEVHVNGGLPPGTYRFSLAENGMTISFSRGISAVCFDTKRFRGVMGPKYSQSSSWVMAFDNAVQAMYHNKVTPDTGGQYWGAPQVINLREKCTGTPVINIYPYRTNFKIEGARQYNILVHCRVQLAVQRISRSAPTHSRVIDLFDIQSSQDSHDQAHPSPPPQRHNKKRARYANANAVQRRSISNEDEEDESENEMDDEVDHDYDAL